MGRDAVQFGTQVINLQCNVVTYLSLAWPRVPEEVVIHLTEVKSQFLTVYVPCPLTTSGNITLQ